MATGHLERGWGQRTGWVMHTCLLTNKERSGAASCGEGTLCVSQHMGWGWCSKSKLILWGEEKVEQVGRVALLRAIFHSAICSMDFLQIIQRGGNQHSDFPFDIFFHTRHLVICCYVDHRGSPNPQVNYFRIFLFCQSHNPNRTDTDRCSIWLLDWPLTPTISQAERQFKRHSAWINELLCSLYTAAYHQWHQEHSLIKTSVR